MGISKRNANGYPDPTAYEALSAVEKTEGVRKAKKAAGNQLFVYICSPYRGDTQTNTQNALKYCRYAIEQGKFPIAPHCYLPRFMDDNDPAEREIALEFGLLFLRHCSAVWVFGDTITEGMRGEINEAKKYHVPVVYFSDKKKGVLAL